MAEHSIFSELALLNGRPPGDPKGAEVEYKALIKWEEGVPTLVEIPERLSKEPESSLRDLLRKCLDLPYDGNDKSLKGLTQGEAMMINWTRQAAGGNSKARNTLIDRFLGKPTQKTESLQLTGNLNEFLDKVAAETRIETLDVQKMNNIDTDVSDL